ncbi:MAG TPA: hypothetical protein VE991_05465 [Acidimicrobiales bacterium]|nr:hypothetical protein [Acidimicrobiales bacterium]
MPQGVDLAAFIEPGVAMLGASADDDLVPEAFRVFGVSWDTDGHLRALISSDATRTLATVKPGTWLCFTFTDMALRSVQVKGRALSDPELPGRADVELMRRYRIKIIAACRTRGLSPLLIEAIRPLSAFAVTVAVEELYDQTPGPTAGARFGEQP